MNRHLGNKITINRHLGDQNNNKSTFTSAFSSHTPMNRHLGNTYITINQHFRHPFTSHSPLIDI